MYRFFSFKTPLVFLKSLIIMIHEQKKHISPFRVDPSQYLESMLLSFSMMTKATIKMKTMAYLVFIMKILGLSEENVGVVC